MKWLTTNGSEEWKVIQKERFDNHIALEFLTIHCICGAITLWLIETARRPILLHDAGELPKTTLTATSIDLKCPACGDTVALAVSTPPHHDGVMHRILESWDSNIETHARKYRPSRPSYFFRSTEGFNNWP